MPAAAAAERDPVLGAGSRAAHGTVPAPRESPPAPHPSCRVRVRTGRRSRGIATGQTMGTTSPVDRPRAPWAARRSRERRLQAPRGRCCAFVASKVRAGRAGSVPPRVRARATAAVPSRRPRGAAAALPPPSSCAHSPAEPAGEEPRTQLGTAAGAATLTAGATRGDVHQVTAEAQRLRPHQARGRSLRELRVTEAAATRCCPQLVSWLALYVTQTCSWKLCLGCLFHLLSVCSFHLFSCLSQSFFGRS